MHDEHEGARRRQRERMKRPEAQAAYSRRQHVGEVPLAVIETRLDIRRFLLRSSKEPSRQDSGGSSTGFNLLKSIESVERGAALARPSTGSEVTGQIGVLRTGISRVSASRIADNSKRWPVDL